MTRSGCGWDERQPHLDEDQPRERGRVGHDDGHPAWCSEDECYLSEGTRVHRQALVSWENETAEPGCSSALLDPADDPHVYVELRLRDLRCKWSEFDDFLPLEVTRRLRDQLTKHLDATAAEQPWGTFTDGCGQVRMDGPGTRIGPCSGPCPRCKPSADRPVSGYVRNFLTYPRTPTRP